MKTIYNKPTTIIILNSKKLKSFSFDQEEDKGGYFHHSYLTYYWKPQAEQSDKEKKKKRIQIIKEESKTVFANDIILYRKNAKDCTKNLLELINKFSKVMGYKINIQKSIAFLFTNNETLGKEIKQIFSFMIVLKNS